VGAGDHDTRPVQQLLLKRGKANLSAYALIGSKSQFGEEENAWNRYFFGHRNGTFLELGGLDGLLYSNSFVLERSFGWRGVIVEGSPGNFEEVVRNRPEVLAIHSAVCNTTRMVAFLERRTKGCCRGVVESLRENSLGQPSESDPRVIQVPCRPLRDVLLESPIRHFNLMFLDVEGGEMGVLQGIDYAAITFDVICVEGNLERASAYEQVLAPQGYDLVRRRVKMRRNAWFVRRGFNASSRDGVYK
jgi:FkbM family methyltransferase